MPVEPDTSAQPFGYAACDRCGSAVLLEVAWKTSGRCSDCFRQEFNSRLDDVIAVAADGAKLRVRVRSSRRDPCELPGRKRSNARRSKRPSVKEAARVRMLAYTRAQRRLAAVFPAIFEVILADERAKLGLEHWTLDRALTPHRVDESTYAFLNAYHSVED